MSSVIFSIPVAFSEFLIFLICLLEIIIYGFLISGIINMCLILGMHLYSIVNRLRGSKTMHVLVAVMKQSFSFDFSFCDMQKFPEISFRNERLPMFTWRR